MPTPMKPAKKGTITFTPKKPVKWPVMTPGQTRKAC